MAIVEGYELTNQQRPYFGLDPISSSWERVIFAGDTYRQASILYFEGDTIKRHIISSEKHYAEHHYDEQTRDRTILLPKTGRGKEKKLTPSILERRNPSGVYLDVTDSWGIRIGSFDTQTTFYSSSWAGHESRPVREQIDSFIGDSPTGHIEEIGHFKRAKRQNQKFKPGDYFRFKISRTEFGFGRVLMDVDKLRKKQLLPNEHGLNLIMMKPVLVQLYVYSSPTKDIDISILDRLPKLPSGYMADNLLFYGEFEVIGHRDLDESEFEFPISYGRSTDYRRAVVFLQWGLIHLELPLSSFNKYIQGKDQFQPNPYGFYSIGFRPSYDTNEILQALSNNGIFEFEQCAKWAAQKDLRSPRNDSVKRDIFRNFGLKAEDSYEENRRLTGTRRTTDVIGVAR